MRGSGSTVHKARGSVILGVAGAMLLGSGGLLAAYYLTGSTSDASAETSRDRGVQTLELEPAETRSEPAAAPASARTEPNAIAAGEVRLTVDGKTVTMAWSDLGSARFAPTSMALPWTCSRRPPSCTPRRFPGPTR